MKYNYTVIIPHKNTPDLLEKCLSTIPLRDDVFTIVIDDDSDSTVVDFENFPGMSRPNTKVIFDKSGRGAGNARNIGLDNIDDTKWLLFSDSDDYFTDYLNEAMDKYVDCDADQIYFKRRSVHVGTDEVATRHFKANNRLDKAIATNDFEFLLFKDLAPVCKFIKYDIVKKYDIRFEPIKFGNDTMFFVDFALHAKSVVADIREIYVVTEREGSLCFTFNADAMECRYNASVRVLKKVEKFGYGKYHPNLFAYCYSSYKVSFLLAIKYFVKGLVNTPAKYLISDLRSCVRAL